MWQFDARHRLRRVVERARALPRDSAGLPVVVVVEPAHPAVAVHRHVQMHLVAGRAELRRLVLHERLQERAAVRFGVEIRQEVVERLDHRVPAAGQLVQRRILDREVPVAHRAAHVHDRVAGDARQPRLRLRSIDLWTDRLIEPAVEEHRVIVASGAPFARLRPHHALHVLDRFPVELVVEAREVVHRALPLLVDVLVALAALLRVHEEVGRDDAAHVGLGRRGKERRPRPAALARHRQRRVGRVLDAVVRVWERALPGLRCQGCERQHRQRRIERACESRRPPPHERRQQRQSRQRRRHVAPQRPIVIARRAGERQEESQHRRQPQCARRLDRRLPPAPAQQDRRARRYHHPQHHVQQHVGHVEDRRRGERPDIGAVQDENQEAGGSPPPQPARRH